MPDLPCHSCEKYRKYINSSEHYCCEGIDIPEEGGECPLYVEREVSESETTPEE